MKISQAAGNIYYHVFAGSCLGATMMYRGKFKEATAICRQSLNLAIENGIEQTGIVGSLYGTLGLMLCERNDLDMLPRVHCLEIAELQSMIVDTSSLQLVEAERVKENSNHLFVVAKKV